MSLVNRLSLPKNLQLQATNNWKHFVSTLSLMPVKHHVSILRSMFSLC